MPAGWLASETFGRRTAASRCGHAKLCATKRKGRTREENAARESDRQPRRRDRGADRSARTVADADRDAAEAQEKADRRATQARRRHARITVPTAGGNSGRLRPLGGNCGARE